MKNIPLYLFLSVALLTLLTNCTAWKKRSTNDAKEIEILSRFLDYQPIEWKRRLSPNGRWLIQNSPDQIDLIQLSSIDEDRITILEAADVSTGFGKTIDGWAPDNKKFVVTSSSYPPGICNSDRVVIYHISKSHQLDHFVFQMPDNIRDCLEITWSPDSSILAITDNAGNIFYINPQAQLIRRYSSHEKRRIGLVWTARGRFATISTYEKDHYSTKVVWFEKQGSDEYQTVMESDYSVGIDGFDPKTEHILIRVGKSGKDEEERFKLWIYDLKTKKVEKEINQSGSVFEVEWSANFPNYIGYLIKIPDNGGERRLFIFDWGESKLVDLSPASFWIGWRSNVNGFLILEGDLNNLSIKVVKRHT